MNHQHNASQHSQHTLPPATFVDTTQAANRLEQALRNTKRIAIDTESNSLYAYREEVCLIQLSTENVDYLIDPLKIDLVRDLPLLGEILADPQIEKVLHAAEYDVMCLRRDFNYTITNLFDTMVGGRILGWEKIGLADILHDQFGVRLNKKHQVADWGKRPLPENMLAYAQMDTHFLLSLQDKMQVALEQGGYLEEARELFDEVCDAEWSRNGFDPDGFWRINGVNRIERRSAAVLAELYLYREEQAQRRNRPVFKIMGDSTLLELAKAAPHHLTDLTGIKGMSQGQIRRYGRGVLAAVERGMAGPVPQRPRSNGRRPDEIVVRRFDALRTWRKERAVKRGVSSDIILSKDTLWELARTAPTDAVQLQAITTLGPWRRKTYGEEILKILVELE